jgi:hypothetical protein
MRSVPRWVSAMDDQPEILMVVVDVGLTASASVEQLPEVRLIAWQIKRGNFGEKHFCGQCVETGAGRVSSPIVSYDEEAQRGVTRSGRIYRLVGLPAHDVEAELTWRLYRDANWIDEVEP